MRPTQSSPGSVFTRHPQYFLDRRDTGEDFGAAIVANARRERARIALQLVLARPVMNHRAHGVVDEHELVDSGASFESLARVGAWTIESRGLHVLRHVEQPALVVASHVRFLGFRIE